MKLDAGNYSGSHLATAHSASDQTDQMALIVDTNLPWSLAMTCIFIFINNLVAGASLGSMNSLDLKISSRFPATSLRESSLHLVLTSQVFREPW